MRSFQNSLLPELVEGNPSWLTKIFIVNLLNYYPSTSSGSKILAF